MERRLEFLIAIGVAAIVVVASTFLILAYVNSGKCQESTVVLCPEQGPGGFITEYALPRSDAGPNGITVDSSGKVWFVEENISILASFNPSNRTLSQYPVPVPPQGGMGVWSLQQDGSGNIWFADITTNAVWRFSPTNSSFKEFPLPESPSGPYQIAFDPAGNLWISCVFSNQLDELKLPQEVYQTFSGPNFAEGPVGLAFLSNGTLLFSSAYNGTIASFDTSSGTFHRMPVAAYTPVGISLDSGGRVWIAQHAASSLKEYDPRSNSSIEIPTSAIGTQLTTLPYWTEVDSQGRIWFNEHQGNKIGVYDPATSTLVEYLIPSRSAFGIAAALTIALDNNKKNLWFTELFTSKIGVVNGSLSLPISISSEQGSNTSATVARGSKTGLNFSIAATQGSTLSSSGPPVLNFSNTEYLTNVPGNLTASFSVTLGSSGPPPAWLGTATLKASPTISHGVYWGIVSAKTQSVYISFVVKVLVT